MADTRESSDITQASGIREAWADGAKYEPYVGRWSRLVAHHFLGWLSVPPAARWLDIGSGTGALSAAILAFADPLEVVGIDRSEAYAAHAREQIADPRVRFEVGDAQALPFKASTLDTVVSGLMLNFAPNTGLVVAEMARVARVGGTVAAYVWDYAGRMELMRHFWDAAVALDAAALELDEGRQFPICQPRPLTDLLRGAGLRDTDVRAIDVPMVFRDFDDFWSPLLGGQGPAPGYATSLDEGRRSKLRERIRAALPIEIDGSIHLIARAWAARGIR